MSGQQYVNTGTPTTRMIEECAELVHALCKVDRLGWFDFHPDRPESDNMDDVRHEMEDVKKALNNLDAYMRKIRKARG